MAKLPIPKFNLRLSKSQKPTLISLVFRYKGKRLVYSTGYSILPKDWDFKKQRPIAQTRRTDLFAIQRSLDDIAAYCTSIFIENDYGAIGIDAFKEHLDIRTGKTFPEQESTKGKITFFEFIKEDIKELKATSTKRNTWKVFESHAGRLNKFAKDVFPKNSFTYEDVDWNFRLKLIDWLNAQNAQLAYGNKTLKMLRQFLEKARRRKLHSNTDYLGDGWVVNQKKAKGTKVVLTVDELGILADLKLTGHLAKVRDICLIGAATGQRYSDFSRYTPNHFYKTIKGVAILSIISIKTDTPAKIPLNLFPWLIPILEQNNYTTPKMSMQKFNAGLKELCKLAEFDEQILVVEQYIGRKAIVRKHFAFKYTLAASHICRRSFATNLYRMGYSLSQIMPMTGHSTESQLRGYIGIDNEMNAEEIALNIMKRQERGIEASSNIRAISA